MKKKIFLPALGAFLVAIGAVMLMQKAPKAPPPHVAAVPENRLKTALDFAPDGKADAAGWTAGEAGDTAALLDGKTKLLWSAKIEGVTFVSLLEKDIRKAMDACAALKPQGVWALPTAGELDSGKSNGLMAVDKDSAYRWITYNMANDHLIPAARVWAPLPSKRVFHVRCIGRVK